MHLMFNQFHLMEFSKWQNINDLIKTLKFPGISAFFLVCIILFFKKMEMNLSEKENTYFIALLKMQIYCLIKINMKHSNLLSLLWKCVCITLKCHKTDINQKYKQKN